MPICQRIRIRQRCGQYNTPALLLVSLRNVILPDVTLAAAASQIAIAVSIKYGRLVGERVTLESDGLLETSQLELCLCVSEQAKSNDEQDVLHLRQMPILLDWGSQT